MTREQVGVPLLVCAHVHLQIVASSHDFATYFAFVAVLFVMRLLKNTHNDIYF